MAHTPVQLGASRLPMMDGALLDARTRPPEQAPTPNKDETRIQRNARATRKPTTFIFNLQISVCYARSVEPHPAQHANLRLLQNTALMIPDPSATATAPGFQPRVDPPGLSG